MIRAVSRNPKGLRVLELLMAGGWGMVPIVICSVLVLSIVVERFWSLRRAAVAPHGLGEEVRSMVAARRVEASHLDALEKTSPLGLLLAGVLRVRHLGRDAVRERVVIGLIRMFLAAMTHGVGDAQYMAGGIGEALVCTAAGLCVAVPAYVFHRYFRSRIASYGIAMEREVLALVDTLDQPAAPRGAPR
jgi:biopolymer transport protein ExbB